MVVAGGDFNCGAVGAKVDGKTGCVVTAVDFVAELTIEVESPTFDSAIVEDCACVMGSGGDFNCGASGAEVDGCAWCVGAGVGSVAELTVKIPSPTFEGSQLEDCARVGSARSQTNGFACN